MDPGKGCGGSKRQRRRGCQNKQSRNEYRLLISNRSVGLRLVCQLVVSGVVFHHATSFGSVWFGKHTKRHVRAPVSHPPINHVPCLKQTFRLPTVPTVC